MRKTLLLLLLSIAGAVRCAPVTLRVSAPAYSGERIFLHRYLDLLTLRSERATDAFIDQQGQATLTTDITGTVKAMLRIGSVSADLFLRPGNYTITFPPLPPGTPRSVNGTSQVMLEFTGLDALDPNMLTTDLYERLDAFVADGLTAQRTVAHPEHPGDSLYQTASRFVNSKEHDARIDTFDRKLRRFYSDVPDPWFRAELDYGLAGLRSGPRANDRALFDRYLKDRPVLYDVPEYLRFTGTFFADHLMRFPFRDQEHRLMQAIKGGNTDSLKAVLMRHDFLRGNDRLTELVMISELYAHYWGRIFDRAGMRMILESVARRSTYAEHRLIATNMLWDLTAMKPGGTMPSLRLTDEHGDAVVLDSLLKESTLLFLTAEWCTICEQELTALEQLFTENGTSTRFIGVLVGGDPETFARYRQTHPDRSWTWLFAGNDGTVMEDLRARSLPVYYLLDGNTLTHSPAPAPTEGLGPILYKLKVQRGEQQRIRPDRGAPKR